MCFILLDQSVHDLVGVVLSSCGCLCAGRFTEEAQRFRNVVVSYVPLAFLYYLRFLLQRECNVLRKGGLYFPTMFAADLNLLILIYIELGFCSIDYVFFLGMSASETENNRQNTEAINFLRHVGVGDIVVREAENWEHFQLRCSRSIQELVLPSAVQEAFLHFYYSVCTVKIR